MAKKVETETTIIKSWKNKISLIMAIVTPTIAVCGAYYKLDTKQIEDKADINARVSAVELTASKSFAEKEDLKEMQKDISKLREDVTEIKTLLKRR
jgi:hypothetical protein